MAEFYNKNEVSIKIEKQLKIINCKKKDDNVFEVELPVNTYFNYQRLVLLIYPIDDGYYISDNGETFFEYSEDTKYYYDMFIEKDSNYHYEIKVDKNFIYKKYDFNFSVIAAVDEFIRFFIYLDDFMNKNDIR